MLMLIGALFSAVLSIAIFKEYSDDGTELIIVSKPINRTKIIITKFIMFIVFSIAFALLSIFIGLATFAFQTGKDHPNLVGSLIFSMFISNLIFTLVFGFIAILVSLFLNKVWTILLNVIIVTCLTIYSTVTLVVAKTPAKVAGDNTNYVQTIKYITNQGQIQSAAALTPIDIDDLSNPLSFDNVDGQIAK
jgi:ABC-2 type transport system permease protein